MSVDLQHLFHLTPCCHRARRPKIYRVSCAALSTVIPVGTSGLSKLAWANGRMDRPEVRPHFGTVFLDCRHKFLRLCIFPIQLVQDAPAEFRLNDLDIALGTIGEIDKAAGSAIVAARTTEGADD